jgi:hypothetical protein
VAAKSPRIVSANQRAASFALNKATTKPRQGVVANTLDLFRNGAFGFIDLLGLIMRPALASPIATHPFPPRSKSIKISPLVTSKGGLNPVKM